MITEKVVVRGTIFTLTHVGSPLIPHPHLIWAHGWGQSGAVFGPLAETFSRRALSTLIDFPGFGQSPPPPEDWCTADYGDATADWLKTLPKMRRVWIGHSFGCRVGLQVAARHPHLLDAMVLIAAAGLRRKRSVPETALIWAKIRCFKLAKLLVSEGRGRDRLRALFGSPDFRAAGPMRSILVNAINEDLSDVARSVRCPTLLIYGRDDRDTPPDMGARFQKLIPESQLVILDGFDHHSILDSGRYQLAPQIRRVLEGER